MFQVAKGAKLALNALTVADGDSAAETGGGVLNLGTLTVSNSTLSGNSAGSGGGIEHSDGSVTLRNTIVANNSPSGGDCLLEAGTSTDGGYNLDSDNTCALAIANRSHPGVDPMLEPLAENGGPTPTHALEEGSPAVDKGRSFGAGADQRGLPRPTDLGPIDNARGGDGSDIGAYEQVRCSGGVVNAAGTIVGTAGPDDDLSGGPGDDFIFGLGGNDRIEGGGGNDEVCSGKGNDTLIGGEGDDTLLGGEGKDKLFGLKGDDKLYGLKGDDRLNTVDRVRKNDLADGGSGQDACKTDSKAERRSCR